MLPTAVFIKKLPSHQQPECYLLMRRISIFIIAFSAVFHCGNPQMHYYLIKAGPGLNEGISRSNNREVTVIKENGLKISLKPVSDTDIDVFADRLELPVTRRTYRLPSLTYLKFVIENDSEKSQIIGLNDAVFSAGEQSGRGMSFTVVNRSEYRKRYTSAAYDRFDYDSLFSFYVTEIEGRKPEDDFYHRRLRGSDILQLKPGEKGSRIVPFKKLSTRFRIYTLKIPLFIKETEIMKKTRFYYRPVRSDSEAAEKFSD